MTERQKRILFGIAASAAIAVSCLPALAGEPHPKMYQFMLNEGKRLGRPYFECSYTNKICEQGWAWSGSHGYDYRVFSVIDDQDRQTVKGHVGCSVGPDFTSCWNFDAGRYVIERSNGTEVARGDIEAVDVYWWPMPRG